MCDQDHFEDDLHEYEKRGLITRRQFGMLVGAGACMVLPQVANAVAVTESDLTITTPDGTKLDFGKPEPAEMKNPWPLDEFRRKEAKR